MASLGHILDRFRRIRLAPGAPSWAAVVPSRTVEAADEIAPLLPALDAIADDAARVVEAARATAARIEAEALERARTIQTEALERAERRAGAILAAAAAAQHARDEAADAAARAEARTILAHARRRETALVERVVARVLEGPR